MEEGVGTAKGFGVMVFSMEHFIFYSFILYINDTVRRDRKS